MPTIFLAHGAPPLLDDELWMRELADWSKALPRPRSILMLSAHWEARPATHSATTRVPLVYDFSGFDEKYYQVQYPSPGAAELAARVQTLLPCKSSTRGLDHGAWVPLIPMYPAAEIPVLQLSLPTLEPAPLFELGRALAPLRDEGVLIVGSGFLTHNLRTLDWNAQPVTPAWASDFDAWTAQALEKRDIESLLDYRALAPGVRQSLPTHEHYVPLFVTLGASAEGEIPGFPIEGWAYGTFSKRSVQFG